MHSLIRSLGASAKEANAFFTLLELGAQPVSTVAKQLNLPRSSTYLLMEKLEGLGLVESFERNKIRYVKCISVDSIQDLINARERKLKQIKGLYEDKLPDLLNLENRLSVTPKIKHFEGKEAVMRMYEEVLKGQSFDAIFNPQQLKAHMPQYFYAIPAMAEIKNVKLRELLVPSPEANEYKNKFERPNHKIRLLPEGIQLNADIIITENEIYMVGYSEKEVSATEIRNPILAQAQRVMFEGWWSTKYEH